MGPSFCVLLAEDDASMREDITEVLGEHGYDVVAVTSGTALVEYLAGCATPGGSNRKPNVIVTDVRMPGQSGLQVLAGLCRTQCTIPVIVMTAFGDSATHAEAHRLGAVAVFDKPFDMDDLRAAIVFATPVHG